MRRPAGALGFVSLALGACAVPVPTYGGRGLPTGRWMNLDLGHHRWVLRLAAGDRFEVAGAWPGANGEPRLHLAAVAVEADEGDADEVEIKAELPTQRDASGALKGTLSLVPGANAGLIEMEGAGSDSKPLQLRIDRR